MAVSSVVHDTVADCAEIDDTVGPEVILGAASSHIQTSLPLLLDSSDSAIWPSTSAKTCMSSLNPVQVSARGMNPAELMRQYGRDIAFWGGGCDTQHALNASDPELVRADVRRRLEEYGPDASLVFTQVHNIQYDVPPQNILALRDEFFRQARS